MFDWNKVFGHVATTAKVLLEAKQHFDAAKHLEPLLAQDRETAREQLSTLISRVDFQQFDQFEVAFLRYTSTRWDPQLRIKAMELYGWIKIQEMARFGKWRGFVNWSGGAKDG